MESIDQLKLEGEQQREAANRACAAAQALARTANRSSVSIITAPVAYDLLGNIKMLLLHIHEVTDNLPYGMFRSLDDTRIKVFDRDHDGSERDPYVQLMRAFMPLYGLTECLAEAIENAENAQQAISLQGYEEAADGPSPLRQDRIDALTEAFSRPAPASASPTATSRGPRLTAPVQPARGRHDGLLR